MSAYSITEVAIMDPEGARRYAETAQAAVEHYDGRFLVLAAEPHVAEGEWPSQQRVVVIEFPDMERLRTWYESPEYAPARETARTALRRRLLFADGAETDTGNTEATVRRFYDALSTGDTSAADEVLTPEWEDIPLMEGIASGPEGFRQTVAFLRGVFPDLTMTVEDMVVSGNRVATRSVARGTHEGALFGIPATGRSVEFTAFDFHRLERGRIARSWHLEDYFGLLTRLGGSIQPS